MSAKLWVATRKGLFGLVPDKGSYQIAQTSFLGDPITQVLHDPRDGAVYAAMKHEQFGNKFYVSKDSGENWDELAVPAYPEPPEGTDLKDPWGKVVPWKLNQIWALAAGGSGQPGVIWAGTLPGGLFKSNDHGASWQLVEPLWYMDERKAWFGGGADVAGIHSVVVNPKDENDIKIGISCGGVWASKDGGETWACKAEGMWAAYLPPEKKNEPNLQDPHCVVQCRDNPNMLWAQHHNGIFKSDNNSESWEEVKEAGPSVFGFTCAVHPQDGNTAWFVPAVKDEKRIPVNGAVCVTRTRDGGKTFEVLTEGLPQEHAYDIVFRHALDIDDAGQALAFGSTTGSLWVSGNQGDAWQHLNAHLPPVYAVCFEKP